MSDFGMHEKRNTPWSVVLGIRFCLTEISAMGYLTGTSTNRFIVLSPLIKCNSGSRVDTVAAVQQMALVTSEPLPWVNKLEQGKVNKATVFSKDLTLASARWLNRVSTIQSTDIRDPPHGYI
jgi:hypothetical protein